MLKSINTKYFIYSSIIYLIFGLFISGELLGIYFLNIFTFLMYYLVLKATIIKQEKFLTKIQLGVVFIVYGSISILLFNLVSFSYTRNFFVFSDIDALMYHNESIIMASKTFSDSINYFLKSWSTEDLGAVLVISSLYRIIDSNLFINFFLLFVGLFTAFGIYRISTVFMSQKYAFTCSISYSLASYVLWFHSSGLKESFMIMLIVLFFDRYYRFLTLRKIKDIVFAALFSFALLLFRPALMFFCFGSIGVGFLISKRKGIIGTLIIVFLIVVLVSFYPLLNYLLNHFALGGNITNIIVSKESSGMIKGGVVFTYAVNILAQMAGPLPTISPDFKPHLSLYAPGLIFRVLLSIPFWLGVFYIFKKKISIVYPLALFVLIEMVSLTIILEGLELRKSLPHFPALFIISFWFLDKYDLTDIFRRKPLIKKIFHVSALILLVVIFYWNFRYK